MVSQEHGKTVEAQRPHVSRGGMVFRYTYSGGRSKMAKAKKVASMVESQQIRRKTGHQRVEKHRQQRGDITGSNSSAGRLGRAVFVETSVKAGVVADKVTSSGRILQLITRAGGRLKVWSNRGVGSLHRAYFRRGQIEDITVSSCGAVVRSSSSVGKSGAFTSSFEEGVVKGENIFRGKVFIIRGLVSIGGSFSLGVWGFIVRGNVISGGKVISRGFILIIFGVQLVEGRGLGVLSAETVETELFVLLLAAELGTSGDEGHIRLRFIGKKGEQVGDVSSKQNRVREGGRNSDTDFQRLSVQNDLGVSKRVRRDVSVCTADVDRRVGKKVGRRDQGRVHQRLRASSVQANVDGLSIHKAGTAEATRSQRRTQTRSGWQIVVV